MPNCRPRLPLRTFAPTTTEVPFTTPSMVDMQSWNFTNPSDVAKDCFNSMGISIVSYCQNKSEADYDPVKMHTTTTTTWETCCALFDELSCYTKQAANFCPTATRNALIAYSKKVAFYFNYAICPTIPFSTWQAVCNNETHAQISSNVNHTLDNNPNLKPNFVNLPPDDGPEKACFTKLRKATTANGTVINLEEKCMDTSLDKWDPNRRKLMESAILEACCSIYDSLECIQKQSASVCTGTELTDMDNYRKKSLVAFSSSMCKTVPYEKASQLCNAKAAASGLTYSLFTAFIATLAFLTLH